MRKLTLLTSCLVVLAACLDVTADSDKKGAGFDISKSKISELHKGVSDLETQTSAVKKRRTCKTIIRKGNSLVEKYPEAPNRFEVLNIVFQTQKQLLGLDNSERNREGLFETCATLLKAPDEYAELRLEADFIMMERDMSLKEADLGERARVLAGLIKRYRDTSAEAKSLMMATLIAPKLEAFDLEKEIHRTMDERFAGDLDVIEWRRTHRDYAHFRLIFKGTFTRIDGAKLTFPIDGLGHTCVLFFWSETSPELEVELLKIKDLQLRFPNQFRVFSFNVDELADGGERTLRKLGLDWTIMTLPGGKRSQIYRVYAGRDPVAVRVNAHGHALLPSNLVRTEVEEMAMEQNFDELRYLAQLQSLLTGDFLVRDFDFASKIPRTADSMSDEVFAAVQNCFVLEPFRYRLSEVEALTNYRTAAQLSRDAIAEYPKAPGLWYLRNLRIVALLGMWNLSIEPKFLELAAEEARAALAEVPPPEGELVPQFCLAKVALRKGDAKPDLILDSLINAIGKENPMVLAAAAILAIDANAGELHRLYRDQLLSMRPSDSALWPVVSFLRDQNQRFRLFKANYYLPPSRARRNVRAALRSNAVALDLSKGRNQLFQGEFQSLDGEKLSFPAATRGKLTLLMFVEPPGESSSDFSAEIKGRVAVDARGKTTETMGVMQRAFQLADQDLSKSTQVVAAFLSDDKERVEELVQKEKWPCKTVLVPGGLKNPLVRQLGILSADFTPNIFLLRPDGTVAWSLSGIIHPQHKSEGLGEYTHTVSLAMMANLEELGMAVALKDLKEGRFGDAVKRFSGPLPTDRKASDRWLAPQLHGRAVAHMGMKNWDDALADLDAAILAHERTNSDRKQCDCLRIANLLTTKAAVLRYLDRGDEAKAVLERAEAMTISHRDSRYETFHDELDLLSKKYRK